MMKQLPDDANYHRDINNKHSTLVTFLILISIFFVFSCLSLSEDADADHDSLEQDGVNYEKYDYYWQRASGLSNGNQYITVHGDINRTFWQSGVNSGTYHIGGVNANAFKNSNVISATFYNCCQNPGYWIGDGIFEGSSKLQSVDFSRVNLSNISSYAFKNCTSLNSVSLPSTLTSISKYAFENCYSLKYIEIPVSVTTIDPTAFKGCCGLTVKCGNESYQIGHTPVVDPAIPATCTAPGLTEGSHCRECGATLVEQQPVSKLAHDVAVKEAVPATCISSGLTNGYVCMRCGEIIVPQKIVPELGHITEIDRAVAATCTDEGLTEGSHCPRCNTIFVPQKILPILAHSIEIDLPIEATCSSSGLTEGSHCTLCNGVLVCQEIIDKLPHTLVIDEKVDATLTSFGITEGSHCSVCEEVIIAQTVIPVLSGTKSLYNGTVMTTVVDGDTIINTITKKDTVMTTVLDSGVGTITTSDNTAYILAFLTSADTIDVNFENIGLSFDKDASENLIEGREIRTSLIDTGSYGRYTCAVTLEISIDKNTIHDLGGRVLVSAQYMEDMDLSKLKVLHRGQQGDEEMEIKSYDSESGIISFWATHFSEYVIGEGKTSGGSGGDGGICSMSIGAMLALIALLCFIPVITVHIRIH